MKSKKITWHEEEWELSKLKNFDRNPRTISEKQLNVLKESLETLGYHHPIACQPDGLIISGHQRAIALRDLGESTIRVSLPSRKLTQAEFKKMLIQANLNNGAFNFEIIGEDFTFEEMTEWGMSEDMLDGVFKNEVVVGFTDEDAVPEPPAIPVTVVGDIWLLGDHRLMCGDSTSIDAVEKLVKKNKINMVYTDPPYGVSIVNSKNKVGGDKVFGKVFDDKSMKSKQIIPSQLYAPIIGDDTTQTAIDSYNLCSSLKIPVMIFWGGNYYSEALPPSSCWIVWDKNNGDSFFADAELAWTNLKTAVRIFKHTWNGLIKESERGQKRVHPTQKPVALAEWCFEKYGKEKDIVLDLFGGSGATLIACEKTKRTCMMMEFSPAYCDVIVKRWQEFTGKEAIHAETGERFNPGV